MLTAIDTSTNQKINLLNTSISEPKKIKWKCPNCNLKMWHVNKSYNGRIEHFRHDSISECLHTESETAEHLMMKKLCYENITTFGVLKNKELEKRIGSHITDVYFENEDGEKFCIECQCSTITVEEYLDRIKTYNQNNCYVLWIFGTKNYHRKHFNNDNQNEVKVRDVEKISQTLYKTHEEMSATYYCEVDAYILSPFFSSTFEDFVRDTYIPNFDEYVSYTPETIKITNKNQFFINQKFKLESCDINNNFLKESDYNLAEEHQLLENYTEKIIKIANLIPYDEDDKVKE